MPKLNIHLTQIFRRLCYINLSLTVFSLPHLHFQYTKQRTIEQNVNTGDQNTNTTRLLLKIALEKNESGARRRKSCKTFFKSLQNSTLPRICINVMKSSCFTNSSHQVLKLFRAYICKIMQRPTQTDFPMIGTRD